MHPMLNLVDRHAGFVGVEDGFFGEDLLIPLYAVGAFMAFTLSQAGMVMH